VKIFHGKIESAFRNTIENSLTKLAANFEKTYVKGMKTRVNLGEDIEFIFGLRDEKYNPYIRKYAMFSEHHSRESLTLLNIRIPSLNDRINEQINMYIK
jgi:hypothetical protein